MSEWLIGQAPIMVWVAGTAAGMVGAWALARQLGGLGREGSRTQSRVIIALVLLALAVGGAGTHRRGRVCDAELRAELREQAEGLAWSLRPEKVAALTFTAQDQTNAYFQALHRELATSVKTLGDVRLYTATRRGGRIVLGPASSSETKPGTVYQHPAPEHWKVFQRGEPRVAGPVHDEHGGCMSALVPVRDPKTGQVLLVLGVEVEWAKWSRAVAQARLAGLLVTLLVLLALAAGGEPAETRQPPERIEEGRL